MSPALNGSSEIQHFECTGAIEICDGIMSDFYPGLPHIHVKQLWVSSQAHNKCNQPLMVWSEYLICAENLLPFYLRLSRSPSSPVPAAVAGPPPVWPPDEGGGAG